MTFTYNHGPEQSKFEKWVGLVELEINEIYNTLSAEDKNKFDSFEDFASAIYFYIGQKYIF